MAINFITFVQKTKAKASEINANFQLINTLLFTDKLAQANLGNDSVGAPQIIAGAVGLSELADDAVNWGTYTPGVTMIDNLDAAVTDVAQWSRVGNTVTVSGRVTIDVTTAGTTFHLQLALPIASNFDGPSNLGGACICRNAAERHAMIAVEATDRAEIQGAVSNTASLDYTYIYQYRII